MIEFLKLHWMLVERLDGTSPLICFGDDGGGGGGSGGGGGGEGGSESSEGVDSSDFDGSGLEGGTGGFDSSDFDGTGLEGGTGGSSVEGGSGTEGGGGAAAGGGAAGGGGDPESDFASLDNAAPSGYADYGSAAAGLGGNIEQGTGATTTDQAAAAQTAGQTVSDFLSSSQNAPSAPGAPDILELAGLAPPGREDKEDKEDKQSTPSTLPSIYDQPISAPTTKELDKEFELEFQRDQPAPPPPDQREIPANAMPTSFSAPYGSQQLDINAFVGPSQKDQSQVTPTSTTQGLTPEQVAQSNQWDIGPTAAVNAFGVGPTANPFASTNVWDFPNPTQAAPPKEEQQPWDQQQTAFNTFGFNPTTPTGYNMPAAISGTPTGAPPPDQQVATGPNPVTTQGFIAPNPTTPVTQGPPLGPAVPTGKSDFISSRDPFSNKDPWNPDYFAPPVGMVMANVPTAPQSSLQEWPATVAAPFGPQAPTQASPQAVAQGPQAQQGQAPMPAGQQAFNTTPISQQSPNLFDLPVGVRGPDKPERDARERSPYDMPPGPPPYGPPAPNPSVIIDTGARPGPPWSDVPAPTVNAPAAPPVEVATPTPPAATPTKEGAVSVAIQDASGNTAVPTSYAPDQQTGNPLAGGAPGGVVELPSSQPGQGDGGLIPLPPQRQQLSAQRKKLNQTEQQKRDAITEALMRRDLFAPGVSDFDRLRLQP